MEMVLRAESRLRLKPGYYAVILSSNECHIKKTMHGKPLIKIEDAKQQHWVEQVMLKLQHGGSVSELIASAPVDRQQEVRSIIKYLAGASLIHTEEDMIPGELGRLLVSQRSGNYIAALHRSRVVLIGSGQLAVNIADGLSRYGIRDYRMVEVHDGAELNSALASHLPCSLCIVCLDEYWPSIYETVDRFAAANHVPWSLVTADNWTALVGPTFFPGQTACYQCYLEDMNQSNPELYRFTARLMNQGESMKMVNNPLVSNIAANLMVSDIGNLLVEEPALTDISLTAGRRLALDLTGYHARFETFLKAPRCKGCDGYRQ
ncbi:TOMM precursor leader peptide-binding protein [Paenibacillus thiaminolyticus]|uniref:TOMM precursor leader peptide-binding protein n=1 Tax=Paenibacillus thiaminolyticus TaxID=49283 RepID=UPI002351063E|nr:TOMM precursor leader peptide-binding protein [Paenibacillus thiaminolyticus]WCR26651.1 TOMM precursor leader peptide-binding protein [Paenibacillus thiaminolyticus]